MQDATNSELQENFAKLARWTWNRLADCHRREIAFSEETITETLLYQLSKKFSGRGFEIKSFNKYEEGTSYMRGAPTGADWEFWIADKSWKGIRLRIQAKRLFLESGKYESFDATSAQHKNLENSAHAHGAIPLYVLYNGPTHSEAFPKPYPFCMWQCCGPFCLSKFSKKHWGCAVALPSSVHMPKQPEPIDIFPMWPWHCLFCPSKSSHANLNLPMLCLEALQTMGLRDTLELSSEVPRWVAVLREGRVPELEKGLKGVVLIQDNRTFESTIKEG
jgi:hypothetical protein